MKLLSTERHSLKALPKLIAIVTASTVRPLGGHWGSATVKASRPLEWLISIVSSTQAKVTWEVTLSEGLSRSGLPELICGGLL